MGIHVVKAELAGNVVEICVNEGDRVVEGDPIIIMESMKMEIPVSSTETGVVTAILVETLQAISEGDGIANIETG